MLIKNISKKLYSMNNELPKFAHTLYEKKPINYDSCTCVAHLFRMMYRSKLKKKKHVVMDDIFYLYQRTFDRRYIVGAPGK